MESRGRPGEGLGQVLGNTDWAAKHASSRPASSRPDTVAQGDRSFPVTFFAIPLLCIIGLAWYLLVFRRKPDFRHMLTRFPLKLAFAFSVLLEVSWLLWAFDWQRTFFQQADTSQQRLFPRQEVLAAHNVANITLGACSINFFREVGTFSFSSGLQNANLFLKLTWQPSLRAPGSRPLRAPGNRPSWPQGDVIVVARAVRDDDGQFAAGLRLEQRSKRADSSSDLELTDGWTYLDKFNKTLQNHSSASHHVILRDFLKNEPISFYNASGIHTWSVYVSLQRHHDSSSRCPDAPRLIFPMSHGLSCCDWQEQGSYRVESLFMQADGQPGSAEFAWDLLFALALFSLWSCTLVGVRFFNVRSGAPGISGWALEASCCCFWATYALAVLHCVAVRAYWPKQLGEWVSVLIARVSLFADLFLVFAFCKASTTPWDHLFYSAGIVASAVAPACKNLAAPPALFLCADGVTFQQALVTSKVAELDLARLLPLLLLFSAFMLQPCVRHIPQFAHNSLAAEKTSMSAATVISSAIFLFGAAPAAAALLGWFLDPRCRRFFQLIICQLTCRTGGSLLIIAHCLGWLPQIRCLRMQRQTSFHRTLGPLCWVSLVFVATVACTQWYLHASILREALPWAHISDSYPLVDGGPLLDTGSVGPKHKDHCERKADTAHAPKLSREQASSPPVTANYAQKETEQTLPSPVRNWRKSLKQYNPKHKDASAQQSHIEGILIWLHGCTMSHKALRGHNGTDIRLIYCLSLLPSVKEVLELSEKSFAEHAQIVAGALDLKAEEHLAGTQRPRLVGWLGSAGKDTSVLETFKSFSHAELVVHTLEAGSLQILNYCVSRAVAGQMADFMFWEGEHAWGHLQGNGLMDILDRYCKPAIVAMFNSRRTHVLALQELRHWQLIASGRAPCRSSPGQHSCPFDVFVHEERVLGRSFGFRHLTSRRDSYFADRRWVAHPELAEQHQAAEPADSGFKRPLDADNVSSPRAHFDMLTVMRVPTCVNYHTVTNAARYLTVHGLRRIWVATHAKFVSAVNSWGSQVYAIDDSKAVPGVSYDGIRMLLEKYGWTDRWHEGRSSAGWYLMQFLNLGFALRDDVAEFLLLHDADMMFTPHFKVFGQDTFRAPDGRILPRVIVKTGSDAHTKYDYAYRCLTGRELKREREETGGGIFVTHTWTAFRPYLRKFLEEIVGHPSTEKRKPSGNQLTNGTAAWVETIIQCLDPAHPHVGFGESCSYLSYVLRLYPYAHEIQEEKTWLRNPARGLQSSEGGFCCPTQEIFNYHAQAGWEFVGIELGHTYTGFNGDCGYNTEIYKGLSPYPPASHPFWIARGVRFNLTIDSWKVREVWPLLQKPPQSTSLAVQPPGCRVQVLWRWTNTTGPKGHFGLGTDEMPTCSQGIVRWDFIGEGLLLADGKITHCKFPGTCVVGSELTIYAQQSCGVMLLSTFITSEKDWQRGIRQEKSFKQFASLYASVFAHGMNMTLFYDDLPGSLISDFNHSRFQFVPINVDALDRVIHPTDIQAAFNAQPRYSMNDLRFLLYDLVLKRNLHWKYVFLVDAFDMRVARNPCERLLSLGHGQMRLYIQSEANGSPMISEHGWMDKRLLELGEEFQSWGKLSGHKKVLSAGLVGGHRDIILPFLKSMLTVMLDPEVKGSDGSVHVNMAALNYVAYTEFQEYLYSGAPLHSEYKKYEDRRTDVWFIHK